MFTRMLSSKPQVRLNVSELKLLFYLHSPHIKESNLRSLNIGHWVLKMYTQEMYLLKCMRKIAIKLLNISIEY
jgi:hypothetical protein